MVTKVGNSGLTFTYLLDPLNASKSELWGSQKILVLWCYTVPSGLVDTNIEGEVFVELLHPTVGEILS